MALKINLYFNILHNSNTFSYGIHGYSFNTSIETKKYSTPNKFIIGENGYIDKKMCTLSDPVSVNPIEYIDGFGNSVNSNTLCFNYLYALNIFLYRIANKANNINIIINNKFIYKLTKFINKLNISKDNSNNIDNTILGLRKSYKNISKDELNEIKKYIDLTKNITTEITYIKPFENNIGIEYSQMFSKIYLNNNDQNNDNFNIEFISPKNYWNPKIEKHPFLDTGNVFFNTVKENNIPGKYVVIKYKDDEDHGKKLSDITYSIIHLNEPDRIIELIKDLHYKLANGHNVLAVIKLRNVYNKLVFPVIDKLKNLALIPFKLTTNQLNFIHDEMISIELDTSTLSMRSIDYVTSLDSILKSYIENTPLPNINLVFKDVTELFYKSNNTLNNEIDKDGVKLVISHNEFKINISIGIDTVSRNTLKKLENKNTKIQLCTWNDSDSVLRYCTILTSDIGYGIWSSIFMNTAIKKQKETKG